jgi:hypothetical protein
MAPITAQDTECSKETAWTTSTHDSAATVGRAHAFKLEWILPLELGLSTHVTLFDLECDPPHALAAGQGGDEADALLDLWTTLTDQHDSPGAVAHVAEAYHRRTGRQPEGER